MSSETTPRCLTCKWWKHDIEDYDPVINPPDPVTFDTLNTEAEVKARWGHNVRYCTSPKVLFYQRPDPDGAAVVDGSEYTASLMTGEQFGCVLHERES